MRRPTAAMGSAVFFLLAPGVVVGLIPWLLTRWQAREPVPYWAPMRVLGAILLVAGLIALIRKASEHRHRSPLLSAWSSAGRIATSATPCMWLYWRPSLGRR
jgi:hypothetical protein